MDRPALFDFRCRQIIYRLTEQVEDTSKALVSYRHRNRAAQIHCIRSADQSVRRTHSDTADHIISDLLRDLGDQPAVSYHDLNGIQQVGQFAFPEADVQNRACDLYSAPATISVISCVMLACLALL